MGNHGAIALNEDNSHYFFTRAGQHLDAEAVESFVDQYTGTQVRQLMLCPNGMRASYASTVRDRIWDGYEPDAGDDQPFFDCVRDNPDSIKFLRGWVHTAWQLQASGIDVYERWISRCRKKAISPWISVRMNDVHDVDNERHLMHSRFWRENPQFRRIGYRFAQMEDRALDYSHKEVRDHYMSLIRELAERYDFDGLELDWMRFGYHFAPGTEQEGVNILNDFTSEVRALLNEWAARRGHEIKLSARVPSKPQNAVGLGMDAVKWAKRGLIDMLVVTPFWHSIDTDMPIELWKQLLEGTGVALAAGLEVLVRPYFGYTPLNNSLETSRGAAISALHRGADCIYLFNYIDEYTGFSPQEHASLLRELGSIETLAGKPRRHVVTFADTWAVGEPRAFALPAVCSADGWAEFRVHIGPKPDAGDVKVVLGIESGSVDQQTITLIVNGKPVEYCGVVGLPAPNPECPAHGFSVPLSLLTDGYNVLMLTSKDDIRIGWVEITIEQPDRD